MKSQDKGKEKPPKSTREPAKDGPQEQGIVARVEDRTIEKRKPAHGCERFPSFLLFFSVLSEDIVPLDKLIKRIPHRQGTQRNEIYVSARSNPIAQLRRAQHILTD